MNLKYKCHNCQTPLGYDGLCFRCKAEKDRSYVASWSYEKIRSLQFELAENIGKLNDLSSKELEIFWGLLAGHNAITPYIQSKAVEKQIYSVSALYYRAKEDVRDKLIAALDTAVYQNTASDLMCCLAMQGDDKALETLLELERHPRPWRQFLHVDPSVYAQEGGWTFDKSGKRIQLNFDVCFPMVKSEKQTESPVRIGRIRKDVCPHCGGPMVDILVVDGRDERLAFLGLDGILTATCCPNCVGFLTGPAFNRFSKDGSSEVLPSCLFDGSESFKCYIPDDEYQAMEGNALVLDDKPKPLFYGVAWEDVNTIGGFANWVQDCEYTMCPDCGKPMKLLGQIQWSTLFDGMEGTLYIEFCPDCKIVSMQHQQT